MYEYGVNDKWPQRRQPARWSRRLFRLDVGRKEPFLQVRWTILLIAMGTRKSQRPSIGEFLPRNSWKIRYVVCVSVSLKRSQWARRNRRLSAGCSAYFCVVMIGARLKYTIRAAGLIVRLVNWSCVWVNGWCILNHARPSDVLPGPASLWFITAQPY